MSGRVDRAVAFQTNDVVRLDNPAREPFLFCYYEHDSIANERFFSRLHVPCVSPLPPRIFFLLQLETILLDYDETSVITIFDQTKDEKHVFEGVEVRWCS